MSSVTLATINPPPGGTFTLPSGTLYQGASLSVPSMTNPTVTPGVVTSGGSTTTSSQTVNILTSSLKPRLSTNNGVNSLRFQFSTTPTNLGTQVVQFALPGRTTAVSAVSDVYGNRPNARDAGANAINDAIVGGVVAASGTPTGFVQFTANSTSAAHFIDVSVDYIS